MTLVARLLALFFALLFVGTTTLFATSFTVRRHLLQPAPYKQALGQVNAYERAPGILAQSTTTFLQGEAVSPENGVPWAGLTQEDYEILFGHLLPGDWLQSQTEAIVDQTFLALESGRPAAPITLSLLAFKENLTGQAGTQALMDVIATRPPCPEGELSALTCGFDLQEGLSCRPPALTLQLCSAVLDTALAGAAGAIPDRVEINTLLQAMVPSADSLLETAAFYRRLILLVAGYGWIASGLFLLLTTAFAVRSLRGWFRWWGVPLLGVSFCLLPLAALTWLAPTWYVSAPLGDLRAAAPALGQLLADVFALLGRRLALELGVATLILGAAGLGLLLLSFLVPARASTRTP